MPAFREQGKGTRTSVHVGIFGGGLSERITSMLFNRSPIQADGSKWTEEDDNPPIQFLDQSANLLTILCYSNVNPGPFSKSNAVSNHTTRSAEQTRCMQQKKKSLTIVKHHIPTDYDRLLSDRFNGSWVSESGRRRNGAQVGYMAQSKVQHLDIILWSLEHNSNQQNDVQMTPSGRRRRRWRRTRP